MVFLPRVETMTSRCLYIHGAGLHGSEDAFRTSFMQRSRLVHVLSKEDNAHAKSCVNTFVAGGCLTLCRYWRPCMSVREY